MPRIQTKHHEGVAVQWTGDMDALRELKPYKGDIMARKRLDAPGILVLEGRANGAVVEEGDWVIKGPDDFLYPCRKDAFDKIYEVINE